MPPPGQHPSSSELVDRQECGVCGAPPSVWTLASQPHDVSRCRRCSAYFWNKQVAPDHVAALFDDYEWTGDYSAFTPEALETAKRALTQKIGKMRDLSGRDTRRMLDVGCGNGLYVKAALELGLDAAGTDVDARNVAAGREQGLDLRHGFMEEMAIEDAFDFIHVKGVLHLIADPSRTMAAAFRALHERGGLFVDATNQHGLASRFRMLRPKPGRFGQISPPIQVLGLTPTAMRHLGAAAGFSGASMFTFSYGDAVHYPRMGRKDGWDAQYAPPVRLGMRAADRLGLGGFIGAYFRKGGLRP